jgi:CheY-like chemotaxis protein
MCNFHILIVEDNELNREILEKILQKQGYKVSTVTNGLDGVQKVQELMPDLVLMDIGLPDIDGFEATMCIKRDERTQNIPVIALTAYATSGDKARALEAGCDAFESKPVQTVKLLNCINYYSSRVLGLKRRV